MSTHILRRRRTHSGLKKKRYQPAHLPGLHTLEPVNSSGPDVSKRQELEEDAEDDVDADLTLRQFGQGTSFTIPGMPLTDLFPPTLPGRPTTTDTTTSTTSTIPIPSSTIVTTTSTSSTPSTTVTSTTSSTTSPTTTTAPSTTALSTSQITTTPQITTAHTVVTEVDNATVVITSSFTRATSSTSAAAASSTGKTDTTGGSSSSGSIIGGIVAGVIAIAVLVLALVWFFRRRKRADLDDLQSFNPHDFRRSAVLINDDSLGGPGLSAGAGLARGFSFHSNGHESAHNGNSASPRPPTMIERKLAHTPVNGGYDTYPSSHGHEYASNANYGFGAEVGAPAPYGINGYGYPGYQNHQHVPGPPLHSYLPQSAPASGQVVEHNVQNPFMTPVLGYPIHSPFSPPVPQESDLAHSTDSALPSAEPPSAAVLAQVGGAPVLTRNISTRSTRPTHGKQGKSGQLSISIPRSAPVNATVVNGSVGEEEENKTETQIEYPVLKRQGSASSLSSSKNGSMKRNNSVKAVPPPLPIPEHIDELPSSDYVDLARSSVSPFQAAQYAEISKRLNAEVPQGLPAAVATQMAKDRDLPPIPPTSPTVTGPNGSPDNLSPFADPTNGTQIKQTHKSRGSESVNSSISGVGPNELLDFPIPPPSPMALTSRHSHASMDSTSRSIVPAPTTHVRIDSLPPQLPEISLSSSARDGKYDSYLAAPGMMGLGTAKDSPIYPSGITAGASPLLGRFPVTPSPLGTTFGLDTPRTADISGGAVRAEQGVFRRLQEEEERKIMEEKAQKEKSKEKERPLTVYDEGDVYGGF
ncbi:hypothetical protein DFP72DRAFT_408755 [Ephemerocybe angulata]|uniref:Uncharacterized protein n=1 Tax=Ephemerocybe angulata TaxID=980116 RepID=A0A8H6HVD9_9AGAR|nr:hypothetical protein DFP72DRAFT_408755 [Tulosesus angulatus]